MRRQVDVDLASPGGGGQAESEEETAEGEEQNSTEIVGEIDRDGEDGHAGGEDSDEDPCVAMGMGEDQPVGGFEL